VDEFQDISRGRARLLRALLDQHPAARLYAVGDDWQSIYRFAGADVSLMTSFADYFGTTERSDLTRTFRCVDRVSDVAASFVTRNPAQLQKKVGAARRTDSSRVHVGFAGTANPRLIRSILRRVGQELGERASVLLLGRYRTSQPPDLEAIQREFPRLDLRYLTIHRSKGLEADAVIVLDLNSGARGFPSEARDDPILNLVLATPETFRHAEERRLLYVAITRARHAAYLLVSSETPSEFVEELTRGGYDVRTFGDAELEQPLCPECETTRLRLREGAHGRFWGCLNYPYCKYTEDSCRRCFVGWMSTTGDSGTLRCGSCDHAVTPCPECESGQLVTRSGPHGEFLGCSAFPRCRARRSIQTNGHDSPVL
jgi:DNA helicase-4